MRLYEESIENFSKDVINNEIADKIAKKFEEYYKRKVGSSEYNSWNNSMNFVKNILDLTKLKDNYIIVEYELPYSEKRIDVILLGKDDGGNENAVVIELKQWSNNNVYDSKNEGNIVVDYGRFKRENPHPSLQVEGYYWHLMDFMSVFYEEPKIKLSACVYCHNYNNGDNEVLYLPKFKENLNKYPLFSKESNVELGNYLKDKLSKGGGLDVLNRFAHSILKPSRKLLEHTKEMINEQQIFNLIDEQITAYNAIMSQAKKLSKSKEKSVVIIQGGPGTGKSVIALEVMGELLRRGKNVVHATGSSAFTNTLRKILGIRASKQFKFFNSFIKNGENDFDVLICDEAHRIRQTSESRWTPKSLKTGKPQIEELINSSKLSIFFIDEKQVVRPNEIGSVDLIKKSAEKMNAKVYEMPKLQTQFRCGGSGKYLDWIEKVLKMGEIDEEISIEDDKMNFEIIDSPHKLKEIIDEKNKEKKNSARIVAGFCWKWSNPNSDGSLQNDVKIGDFEMPWEKKNDFWKWATDDSGMKQIGTVYTSQGFEFDYIGVIFGNDLVYNNEKSEWESKPENLQDNATKRRNPNLTEHLKNVYRVLLSRAHKGVYVYFMDKSTEEYFKKMMKVMN